MTEAGVISFEVVEGTLGSREPGHLVISSEKDVRQHALDRSRTSPRRYSEHRRHRHNRRSRYRR
jgi:hypothetical protein